MTKTTDDTRCIYYYLTRAGLRSPDLSAMATTLPNRQTFWNECIRKGECGICNDQFDRSASQISTPAHACPNYYHRICLEEHFKTHNTCPTHHDIVLFELAQYPNFTSGVRVAPSALDQIRNPKLVASFVNQLNKATKSLCQYEQIFDSDLNDKIQEILELTAERYNLEHGLLIKKKHWAAVMSVAKDMIREHFKHQGKDVVNEATAPHLWMPKMNAALGWKF